MTRRPLLACLLAASCTAGGGPAAGTWPDGGLLTCAQPPCTFLFAALSLDDRLEVFSLDDGPAYRGSVDLDLDPNPGGDYGDDRLDEPYETAVLGPDLLVPIGHYPARDRGSLLWLPLSTLADHDIGATVPKEAFFDGAAAVGGARLVDAGAQEAIFVARAGAGAFVTAVENDLFAPEDTWTHPGSVQFVDGGAAGVPRPLDDLPEGACDAAGEVVVLPGGRLAVACDGNEAVAFYAVDGATISPVALCDLPPVSNARVRAVAAAGDFVVVAESPVTASADPARLWRLDEGCALGDVAEIAPGAAGTLTDLVAVGDAVLVAGTLGRRGIHPVRTGGEALEACPPLSGLEDLFTGADGRDLEPVALAATADGGRLVVGTGPFLPAPDDPGYGKLALVDLAPGACGPEVVAVSDLTDGATGHAPAVAAGAGETYRRMPGPLTIHRVRAEDLAPLD